VGSLLAVSDLLGFVEGLGAPTVATVVVLAGLKLDGIKLVGAKAAGDRAPKTAPNSDFEKRGTPSASFSTFR
jgi:hypothetical protein